MQVIAVPVAELPAGHEWVLIEHGPDVTAYMRDPASERVIAEVEQAIARVDSLMLS